MEDWTKYVLDNVGNEKVLHYCVANLSKELTAAIRALADEKNQLATEYISEMNMYMQLLESLDEKMNGKKSATVIA